MTRSSMRLWALTGLLFVFIACAKAEGGETIGEGDGDGDGDNGQSNSGGTVLSSSGGVVIGSSGGSSAASGGVTIVPMGGATSTGGMANLGGAGTGGSGFNGQCAGVGELSTVIATGDQRVYTCPTVQSNCPAEAVGVPALFECVSTHVPNCTGQTPDGATSWELVGLCSETAMGGAN